MTLISEINRWLAQKEETAPKQKVFHLLPSIIDGGVAGIAGITFVFPLDLVVTRMQNQQVLKDGRKMYKSMWDCLKKTYKKEHFYGLYRGYTVNVLFTSLEKAIFLSSNDYFSHFFIRHNIFNEFSFCNQIVSGGIAGALQFVVTTPMELLKIQMQDAGRIAGKYKTDIKFKAPSATELTIKILRTKGLLGLYNGTGLTILREVIFSVVYFPLVDWLNDICPKKNQNSTNATSWCAFLSGVIAGSVGAFVATPVDLVKTRVQTTERSAAEIQYNSVMDCIAKTYKYEGVKAFFRGGLGRVFLIAPLFGVTQVIYFLGIGDECIKKLNLPKF